MSVEAQLTLYQPEIHAIVDWPDEVAELIGVGAVVAGPPGKVTAVNMAALTAIASDEALVDGVIYNVTDGGFLAVPLTGSGYRSFHAIHVGPTPPDDTAVIWLQTS